MVIYRTGDGQPGYHQTEELDEAVKFVERLRNGDGVDSARIFQMEEVNFDFRPYFKVEIGPSGEPIPAPAEDAVSAPASTPEPAAAPPAPMPAPEPAPLATSPDPEPVADAWGDLSAEADDAEPTPLVEQAASFMPDPEENGHEGNGDHAEEGVGARRGLFGR
ncbi:MAG: hypothetical protein AAGK32_00265 [Actinomycetota bacterium]